MFYLVSQPVLGVVVSKVLVVCLLKLTSDHAIKLLFLEERLLPKDSAANTVNDPLLEGNRLIKKRVAHPSDRLLAQAKFPSLFFLLLGFFYGLLYNFSINLEVESSNHFLDVIFDIVSRENRRLVVVGRVLPCTPYASNGL